MVRAGAESARVDGRFLFAPDVVPARLVELLLQLARGAKLRALGLPAGVFRRDALVDEGPAFLEEGALHAEQGVGFRKGKLQGALLQGVLGCTKAFEFRFPQGHVAGEAPRFPLQGGRVFLAVQAEAANDRLSGFGISVKSGVEVG